MKRLAALILGLLSSHAKADSPKLGSDTDIVRQMLFASQSLKELAAHVQPDAKGGAFQALLNASKLAGEGRKTEAIAQLRSILEVPPQDTRLVLWVWSALRELGEKPDAKHAFEVLGVVIEVPSGGAYDTLAAYVDGTARYLNFSGRAILWDAEDSTIKALCQAFVDSTIPASTQATPRVSLALPRQTIQITLLTRSGIFVISNPPEPVMQAGVTLMMELMKRTKEGKG
ncbi:MAG: hypothetical protein V4773_07120 [Verrucomicrobiota bacterium]